MVKWSEWDLVEGDGRVRGEVDLGRAVEKMVCG